MLEINNLCYSYGDERGLEQISLRIGKGEKIGIVGANGSGKSTFFLNLAGVLIPDKGHISHEKKVCKKDDLIPLVGLVFQEAEHQIIASTVSSEVSFGPMNMGLSYQEVKERVDKALAYMNLVGFEDRAPHYLSGGEKKRVTIADIIAMESPYIVFDEPTTALDIQNIKMLEQVLEQLYQEGKTLIVSSHDMDFIYRWADRVIVFCEGRIIADAPVDIIFGDDKLLERAKLTKPMLLEVCQLLEGKGYLSPDRIYAKNVRALELNL